jgi:hypothetical protein
MSLRKLLSDIPFGGLSMFTSLKTVCLRLGLTGVILLIPLLLVIIGFTVLSDAAHAAKPGRCEPWPECKNGGSDGGSKILLGTLHFEPRDGLSGAGLLTDHGVDHFDYSGRMNLPGCQDTVAGEWYIKAQREIVDGTQVWTADGSDLVIDVVDDGQFDGCHGATEFGNGLLTLSLKKTGKGRNKTCSASLDWQFDYKETAAQSLEYFTLQSIGSIPLTTSPFDQCDPNSLNSIELLGDFNFFRNVVENGVTTSNYLETATLDFFVVFHQCPGGAGC